MTAQSTEDVRMRQGASADALRERRMVWAILATALLARAMVLSIVIMNFPRQWLYSRGIEMGLLANSLLHGQGYSSPFGGSTGPTAFIAPGYPTLVAGIFLLFGTYSFASAIAIMTMQVMVNLVTLWLMMYVARQTMGVRASWLAGAVWAVSVPLLWVPTIFWETSFSACILMGAIALALRFRRTPSVSGWVGMGAGCAIAGLINPALLPALLMVMGWIGYQTRRFSRTAPLLGAVTLLVVFAPWPIRNAYRFHAFIPLRSTVGFEMWMGNRPGATGYLDESLFPMYNKAELASYVFKGEVAYTEGKSDEAKAYVLSHPGWFVAMSLRRCFRFWSGTGNSVGSPLYLLHAGMTSLFGFAGLVFLYRRGKRDLLALMVLPLLVFPLPYYVTHAEFRYRVNIDPIMTVLSAYAVAELVRRQRQTVAMVR